VSNIIRDLCINRDDWQKPIFGIKFALVKAKDKTSKPQSMIASNGSKASWQSPQIKVIKSD
jgi:hypothetical protein